MCVSFGMADNTAPVKAGSHLQMRGWVPYTATCLGPHLSCTVKYFPLVCATCIMLPLNAVGAMHSAKLGEVFYIDPEARRHAVKPRCVSRLYNPAACNMLLAL